MTVIGALGVLTSALMGYFFASFALLNDYKALTIASVLALIYLALVTLRMLVIKKAWQSGALIVLDLGLFAVSFNGHFSPWFMLGIVIAGAWLFSAWKKGGYEVENMVQIRLRELGAGFIRSSLHALLFLLIASYLSLVDPKTIRIPRSLVAESVQSVMTSVGQKFIAKMTSLPQTPETEADLKEKAITAIHAGISKIIDTVPEEARAGLLVGIGIIVFLLVNSLTGLLIPVIVFFLWMVVGLLLRINFITIRTEKVDKEIVSA